MIQVGLRVAPQKVTPVIAVAMEECTMTYQRSFHQNTITNTEIITRIIMGIINIRGVISEKGIGSRLIIMSIIRG